MDEEGDRVSMDFCREKFDHSVKVFVANGTDSEQI